MFNFVLFENWFLFVYVTDFVIKYCCLYNVELLIRCLEVLGCMFLNMMYIHMPKSIIFYHNI